LNFLGYSKVVLGDRILVNGGSGGVGSFLVQAAKHVVGKEGTVVAICSAANVELVKGLGADDVVAYNSGEPAEEYLARVYGGEDRMKFDAVIDTIGVQGLYVKCPNFLKEGKTFLNMGVVPYSSFGLWDWTRLIAGLLANNF